MLSVVNEQSSYSPRPSKKLLCQNFKICKNDYLDALLSVQGLLDDATLVHVDLWTSTSCVEGSSVSTMVVAKLARVSKPVCSCVGAWEYFNFSLRILSCLYSFMFSLINTLFLSLILSCFSLRLWFMLKSSAFLSFKSVFYFLKTLSKTSIS